VTVPPRRKRLDRVWEEEFQRAFDEGRCRRAGQIFADNAGASERPGLVIKAALAHVNEDPAVSLRLLVGLRMPANRPIEQMKRRAILGEAYARTMDFASADEQLDAAMQTALALKDGDLVAYVGYRLVRRHMFEENVEKARAALEFARQGSSHTSRINALCAEALILSHEERLSDHAERCVEILSLLDPKTHELSGVRAYATFNLAILARELYIPEALPHIERHLQGLPWPEDYQVSLFQTLKAVAWAHALQGDYFNAFRYLKRASEFAATAPWKTVAACDRSLLARCFGERGWSRVELDEAEQLAASVDWRTSGEERIALLLLAELFAEIDTARSSMYLAQYRSLGDLHFGGRFHRHDVRFPAFAQYSTGIVELALGNRARGLAELQEARTVFDRLGYDFRAARCLVAEYRVTGDRGLLPAIDEKLQHYRQSWLANGLALQTQRPKPPLSPMQQTVFDELCQGKTTAQIATTLARSEYTVNNHIREIFRVFEVKSRAALLAKVARQGLVGGS
jgi:DNA-binding CsgD family transcriptional regulator